MNKILSVFTFVAMTLVGAPALADETDVVFDACKALYPSAVAFDQVDETDNVVCLNSHNDYTPSLGHDTYYIADPALVEGEYPMFIYDIEADVSDTVSLATFTNAVVQTTHLDSIFVKYVGAPDAAEFPTEPTIELTQHDDTIGYMPPTCNAGLDGPEVYGLGGSDTFTCVSGNGMFGGDGDDTFTYVPANTMISAGPGDDEVAGRRGGARVYLVSGNDVARVRGKGASDTVFGGRGRDTAFVSNGDKTRKVEVVKRKS